MQKISPAACYVLWATGSCDENGLGRHAMPVGPTPVVRQRIIIIIQGKAKPANHSLLIIAQFAAWVWFHVWHYDSGKCCPNDLCTQKASSIPLDFCGIRKVPCCVRDAVSTGSGPTPTERASISQVERDRLRPRRDAWVGAHPASAGSELCGTRHVRGLLLPF